MEAADGYPSGRPHHLVDRANGCVQSVECGFQRASPTEAPKGLPMEMASFGGTHGTDRFRYLAHVAGLKVRTAGGSATLASIVARPASNAVTVD